LKNNKLKKIKVLNFRNTFFIIFFILTVNNEFSQDCLSNEVKKIISNLNKTIVLEEYRVGQGDFILSIDTTNEYINFLRLCNIATNKELLCLLDNENPQIKIYGLVAISKIDSIDIFPYMLKYLSSKIIVNIGFNWNIKSQVINLGDQYIRFCRKFLCEKQKNEVDSIILFSNIGLKYRDKIISSHYNDLLNKSKINGQYDNFLLYCWDSLNIINEKGIEYFYNKYKNKTLLKIGNDFNTTWDWNYNILFQTIEDSILIYEPNIDSNLATIISEFKLIKNYNETEAKNIVLNKIKQYPIIEDLNDFSGCKPLIIFSAYLNDNEINSLLFESIKKGFCINCLPVFINVYKTVNNTLFKEQIKKYIKWVLKEDIGWRDDIGLKEIRPILKKQIKEL